MRARVEPSEALFYCTDDGCIPSALQERRIYFRNAREFLLDKVVEAYAYMRDSLWLYGVEKKANGTSQAVPTTAHRQTQAVRSGSPRPHQP